MTDQGNMASETVGEYTVTSNTETSEQITESLAEPEDKKEPEEGKSASEIGKKGGEATAAIKRAKAREAAKEAKAEEVPEPDEPEPEPEEETAAEEDDKPLGKPRHDPKARMLEATRKEAEAKREAKAARERADALEREIQTLRAPKQEAPKPTEQPVGKPKLDDYPTYDEWVEALADWKADQKFKERDEKAQHEAILNDYKGKIDSQLGEAFKARKEYEKVEPKWFDRVSEDVRAIVNEPSFARDPLTPLGPQHVLSDEIIRAGNTGPALTLYLSDHPEEMERILALPTPQEVQVEMRILAKSMKTEAPGKKQIEVSKARPPVRPVAGTTRIADDAPDSEAPYDAHRDYWNKRERARA